MRVASASLLSLLVAAPVCAQTYYVYVGDITPTSVILAWGTTSGSRNPIGRNSTSHGSARISIGDRELNTDRNWIQIKGLEPDRDYPYRVLLGSRAIGGGTVRTQPVKASRLAFFVIGDYGNGSDEQRDLAAVMRREFLRRAQTDNPVRFVLTTGDNLYGWGVSAFGLTPLLFGSGDKDSHWKSRFFEPYMDLLRHVPFYPTLGNHDGGASESDNDLAVYLDNFFFPGGDPARYYRFSFGGLVDFFALDTTENRLSGYPAPGTGKDSEQFQWLQASLASSRAPWKIAYFHHPPFTAGPEHPPSLDQLRHWVELFRQSGVQAVFTGHEHNFQWAAKNDTTGDVQYVVSGAGGQLRNNDIRRRVKEAGIVAWARQRHFLLVEIGPDGMRVTPMSDRPLRLETLDDRPMSVPLRVP